MIRNAALESDYGQVNRKTMDIAIRALDSMISYQGIGDMYRIYLVAQRDQVDFNLAYIPSSFKAPHPAMFDRDYMNKLFDFAYQQAEAGYPWEKVPPGYRPAQ